MKTQKQTKELKQTTKIRLQILRWLSLMQFPAFPGSQAQRLSLFALFRRKQSSERLVNIKQLKR